MLGTGRAVSGRGLLALGERQVGAVVLLVVQAA
jgi:hypothetical protein